MENYKAMLDELKEKWLKTMYNSEAEDHIAMANHMHLVALGTEDTETSKMYEYTADIHRSFAQQMNIMAASIKGKPEGFEINSEEEFYAFIKKLKNNYKINEVEYNALENFVCGIFDNIDLHNSEG